MTSKAAKLRKKRNTRTVVIAKGGRPRIQGPREPSGRLDRKWRAQESEKEACQTVREARQRVFGVSEADATKHEAMTVLGRLKLLRMNTNDMTLGISAEQYDTALDFQKLRNRYLVAIGAAPDYREHGPEAPSSGMEAEEWVERTKAQYRAMSDVLTDLCAEVRSPAPKAAIDVIILRDHSMPELVGALREALNRLAKHFSGQKRKLPELAA